MIETMDSQSMLLRLIEMIKKIMIATGSTITELDDVFAGFQTSDTIINETNGLLIRMKEAMMTSRILDACQHQIITVLDTKQPSTLTNVAIAETLKELKTGHQAITTELEQIVVGLLSSEEQQAVELASLRVVVSQQQKEKNELAEQLLADRKHSDGEIYELLTQLQGAQQKLGEAHRFIAKYSAAAASTAAGTGTETTSMSTTTATTTVTVPAPTSVPPSTFAGLRETAKSAPKTRQNATGARPRSALPPKSLRSLVPRPAAAPADDALVASAKIMAAGMSMGSVGSPESINKFDKTECIDVVAEGSPPSPSQPFPTDMSMVSLRLDVSHSHSYIQGYGIDFDRAWLFQFRAEVQHSLDASYLEWQDSSGLSPASSVASGRGPSSCGGGGMMSAKDCLATVRRLYNFHKDSQAAVRARVASSCSLEQRLYLMMERKYGLRALAVQQASMFLQAMEVYTDGCSGLVDLELPAQQQQLRSLSFASSAAASSSATLVFSSATTTASSAVRDLNELAVFLAAFRNEVEDDFFQCTQTALARAFRDLVAVVQRQSQKQRYKPLNSSIQRVGTATATATTPTNPAWNESSDEQLVVLSVAEWRDHVLRFLYRDDDTKRVVALLKQHSNRPPGLVVVDVLSSTSSSTPAAAAALPSYAKHLLDTSAITQPPRPVRGNNNNYSSSGNTASRGRSRSCSPSKRAWESKMHQLAQSEGALVAFSDVLRILLDYQLLQHRVFLSSIHRAFAACDEDGDGLLGAAELIRCFDLLLQSTSPEGACSTLQHTVDKAADATLALDAAVRDNNNNSNSSSNDSNPGHSPDSPLLRRQQYVKQRAQLRARQKQAAVVAAKNRLREEFVKVVTQVVPIDEQARVNFTTICKCVTKLFT